MPPPNTLRERVDVQREVPGVETGAECEITSVTPSSVNSIPSVVTNEEMPTTAMKKPLIEADQAADEQCQDHRRDERHAGVVTACRRRTA